MDGFKDSYHWLFTELGDPRVAEWPLMSGGGFPLLILATYLYGIKVALPSFMKARPAFDLTTVIMFYNIFQIIANSIVCWGLFTSGYTTTLTFGCEIPDPADTSPMTMRMADWMWWTLMLKVIELVETVFFVLRKKDNQASFLHIYHHCTTMSIIWVGVKYAPGGMASFAPLINTFVHVIMYTYYLLSSKAGPQLKATLNKWKMWLTVIQMVQFTMILVHSVQALYPSCPAPRILVWLYIPNVVLIYYLFYDFFKNTYNSEALSSAAGSSGKSKNA